MDKFVIDTNFFITGFQSQPNTFALFAQICSDLQCKIFIPHLIKNEMRYFLQREVLPYVELVKIDNEAFQHFLRKVYSLTANLPQKPDLSVIFLAHEEDATIVSSDLKLLEVAELLDIKTLTNSAFVRYLLTENRDDTHKQFLQNLEKRLFGEEIRYSVSSTNRYDPVKRIRKIFESALSVVREEYEERIDAQSDIPERDEFSIYALQLKELLEEVIQTPVYHFSYPAPMLEPHWTEETVLATKEVGYKTATTCTSGNVRSGNNPLALKRMWVPFNMDEFVWYLENTMMGRCL